MANNQWQQAADNNRKQLNAAELDAYNKQQELQAAIDIRERIEYRAEQLEATFLKNPTQANRQAADAAKREVDTAYAQETKLFNTYNAAQLNVAEAERAYSASLQQANRQATSNNIPAPANERPVEVVPPPATTNPNANSTDSVPPNAQSATTPRTQVATPYTEADTPTSDRVANQTIIEENAGLNTPFGQVARPQVAVGVSDAQAASEQEPPGEFRFNPKPVLSSEVATAQSASDQPAPSEWNYNPKPVVSDAVSNAQAASGTDSAAFTTGTTTGNVAEGEGVSTAGSVDAARISGATVAQQTTVQELDWRVKLSLAANANYLYNISDVNDILYPLRTTGGVLFPYTPQITNSYRANYESTDIVHSNYKQYFYKNSSVDELQITADFTAQSTVEANYVLAVIHFFRSVTKMFYGQDPDGTIGPPAGVPPPLCYLYGYGPDQYRNHPLLVSQFSYTLPNDVDYIRAGAPSLYEGQSSAFYVPKKVEEEKPTTYSGTVKSWLRAKNSGLNPGGISAEPQFGQPLSNKDVTYIPTKLTITLTCIPIATRYDTTKKFSVAKYAKGTLHRGGFW